MLNVAITREAAKEVLEATKFVSWENPDFQEGCQALEQAISNNAPEQSAKQATVHQVALVQITAWGADLGLYVNGEYVISADPGCGDSTTALKATALALCAELQLPITELEYKPEDEWQWYEVQGQLILDGQLMKPASWRAAA